MLYGIIEPIVTLSKLIGPLDCIWNGSDLCQLIIHWACQKGSQSTLSSCIKFRLSNFTADRTTEAQWVWNKTENFSDIHYRGIFWHKLYFIQTLCIVPFSVFSIYSWIPTHPSMSVRCTWQPMKFPSLPYWLKLTANSRTKSSLVPILISTTGELMTSIISSNIFTKIAKQDELKYMYIHRVHYCFECWLNMLNEIF